MPGAEQAGQPHPVTLPDRQGAQLAGPVGAGVEPGQGHVEAALGVPGVQAGGRVQRAGVLLVGVGGAPGEAVGGIVQSTQGGAGGVQGLVGQRTDRLTRTGGQGLLRQAERPRAVHRPPVGGA